MTFPSGNPGKSNVALPAVVEAAVSDDQLSVFIIVRPPENDGPDVTKQDIMAALAAKRVTKGILEDVIDDMVQSPQYSRMIRVAEGQPATEGRNASLELHFEIKSELKPRVREDGTVDYHDLGLINSVTANQKLCTLHPAEKGIPGYTVTGRPLLPQSVKNLMLPIGKNTRVLEDQVTLVAAINGCVDTTGGKINVLNVFTVTGDVSNATGNVEFDGNVTVTGDVLPGFSVKATGRIEVLGFVEAATLEAGSDIKVNGGIKGKGHGRVRCGGSLRALFIENAEVSVVGDVMADVFMQANIRCGGSLRAEGKRGSILGGTYIVAQSVYASVIGSPSNIVSVFELGNDPMRSDRLKEAETMLRTLSVEQQKLQQIITMLQPLRDAGRITPDRLAMLEKAIATWQANEVRLQELKTELDGLRTSMNSYSNSSLNCRKELFAGTKVTIGSMPYVVASDMLRSKVHLNADREIAITAI